MAFADAPKLSHSTFHRFLNKIIDVRPSEATALAWAWLYIFSLLSAYYIIRPIRDQMGVAGGGNNLQWMFTASLVTMLLLNLPFAWLVAKLPRSRVIPITYRFFAVNILVFAAVLRWSDPTSAVWVGRVFFVWVSTFNLF